MIEMKISGVAQVQAMLRYVAEKVPENGRKVMHKGAETIVVEAKLNAPVLEHAIEDSIHIEKDYVERGRLQITVVAGGVVNGKDVDQYVALIHEHFDSMKPGPGTLAKQAAHPERIVGGKFLERARASQEQLIQKALIDSATKVIQEAER
jgi:hypothetical protein